VSKEWKCPCTICKHCRGEVTDEVYKKHLEDSIKCNEEELKKAKDEDDIMAISLNLDCYNTLMIEFLKTNKK